MLETMRQYALDRLRETDEEALWRNRHFAWVVALAEESFGPLVGPDQGLWIDRLARELDNFRAALQWAIDQKLADGFRLAPRLAQWWVRVASLSEARRWITRLLDAVPPDHAARNRARALGAVGNIALTQGDFEEAERLFRESHALFLALGEVWGSVLMQSNIAIALVGRGQYAAAQPLLMECLNVARTHDDDHLVAVNLGNLAIAAFELGDADRATSLWEEALALARSAGDGFLLSQVLAYKGRAECRTGKLQSAKASFVESLTIAGDLSDPESAVEALEGFAELAAARGAAKRAATILGAAARLREEKVHAIQVHDERAHKRVTAATREALGDDAFDLAWREGRAMRLDVAVRYALNRLSTAYT
jgi:non-specific serine/threonine protein kinase